MFEQHEFSGTSPLFVLLVSFLAPATAFAHAEQPISEQVFAIDGGGWVLQANVGIVQSSNPRELICEESFLGGDNWILGALGETEWLTFGENEVMRTEDGCDFEVVMQTGVVPTSAAVHPAGGNAAFLLNTMEQRGLWVSTDRGMNFENLTDLGAHQTTDLRFVDATTLLVTGYDREMEGAGLAWLVNLESGETTEVALPDDVLYPYVLDASAGYALVLGRRGNQIVFWGPLDDIGKNEYVADVWPTGGRLSDDGRTAWVSGMLNGKGIVEGTLDGDDVATWDSFAEELAAGCIASVDDDLLACGPAGCQVSDLLHVPRDGDPVGLLRYDGFEGVRSDCPEGSDVAEVCPTVWGELSKYFVALPECPTFDGPEPEPDPDPDPQPDAGGDADAAEPEPTPPAGGGCCATTTADSEGAGALLLAMLLFRRRRR